MKSCEYHHATFLRRFLAFCIDSLLIMLFAICLQSRLNFSRESTAVTMVSLCLLKYLYYILSQKTLGKTLGKYVAKVTLVSFDGIDISYYKLCLRYSIDIFLAILTVCIMLKALYLISPEEFSGLPWLKQISLISSKTKNLVNVSILIQLYVYFNLIWLIFNSRNRAFHDVLGGTIVISDSGQDINSINALNCKLDRIIDKLEKKAS